MNESRDGQVVAWIIWLNVGTDVLIGGWMNVFFFYGINVLIVVRCMH